MNYQAEIRCNTMHHPEARHLIGYSMRKNVGIRDAARRLGLAHTTIGRYVRDNPELNRGSRGRPRVNLDELRRHRAANLNPAMRGSHAGRLLGEGEVETPPAAGPVGEAPPAATMAAPPNYALAKAVRETVLAQRARVDLDEKRGLLVPRREIEDAVYEAGLLLQRNLLHLCSQVAERVASMSDARQITELLEVEHRKVLATMAATLRAKVAAGEEPRAPGEVPLHDPRPCP